MNPMETAAATLEAPHHLFAQNDIEVITFYVADTAYAAPVSQVRYIEQDKRKTTRIEVNAKLGAEVTTYQGKPVPIYDFAALMGCEAEYKANLALLGILKAREKDHVDWLNALEYSLRHGTEFGKARDSLLCEFGKWYAGFRPEDELLADIMRDFDTPHRRLHGLADKLLALQKDNKAEEALRILETERTRTLGKLIQLFSAARERLENITRPILLYIDTGKKMIAIRLNAISDIVSYNISQFTHQDQVDDEQLADLSFICGYLRTQDQPPCVLLDWHNFEHIQHS